MGQAETADKKYIEIAERLKSEILAGKYRVGDKIPTIRELSKLYGANPQTVNKATAYLASLGYLKPRQGLGSFVAEPPEKPSRVQGIWMLVDKHRSKLLANLDEVSNYHAKDIYLSYLLEMSRRNLSAGFLVYERDAVSVPKVFRKEAEAVAGFIVQGTLPEAYLQYLAQERIPTVFINRPVPPQYRNKGRFGAVLIDNGPLQQMTNYLMSLGHSRILYLISSEFEENEVFEERYRLVHSSMEAWGMGASRLEVFRYSPMGPESMERFRQKVQEGFSAGIGYNDTSALGVYSLAHACGISIPENFSIAGFDDIMAARTAVPPLTTVHVNRARLSTRAIQILDTLTASSEPASLEEVLPSELIIRRSVMVRKA
ncbi:MAG: hypothetical protein Kow009_07970 [Spirochaetales bacterium]